MIIGPQHRFGFSIFWASLFYLSMDWACLFFFNFFLEFKESPIKSPINSTPTNALSSLLVVGERIYYRLLCSLLTPPTPLHFFLVTSDLSSSDLSVLQLPKDSYLWLHKPFGGCSFYSSFHLFCTMNIYVFFVFLGGMFHFSVHPILFNMFQSSIVISFRLNYSIVDTT